MGSWRLRVDRRIWEMVKVAERAGWTVTCTSKSHVRFTAPDGTTVITSARGGALDQHVSRTANRLRAKGLEL